MGSTEAKECADWTTRTERQNTSENILTMATVQMKNLRLKSNSARLAKVSAIRAPRPLARRNLGATVCRSAATEIVEKLKGITLLEAADLVKQIEETFGVDASASAGVMVAAPG